MKISEYVVVIYNFQTGIANRSILVRKHCFIAKFISWPREGAIQHKEFIIYNFITLDSISTGTTINEYCRNAYASNMLIWTKFMTPYQNFVIPLRIHLPLNIGEIELRISKLTEPSFNLNVLFWKFGDSKRNWMQQV